MGDVGLQRVRSRGRRLGSPEHPDQPLRGDHLVGVHDEHGQQQPLLGTRYLDPAAALIQHLQRAENRKLH